MIEARRRKWENYRPLEKYRKAQVLVPWGRRRRGHLDINRLFSRTGQIVSMASDE